MIPSGFKPMLAGRLEDPAIVRYPVLLSPKLDGIRACVIGGQVYARSLKLIPNAHIQRLFGDSRFDFLDGELIVGPPNDPNVWNATSSGVMSTSGKPNVVFHVFDWFGDPMIPYLHRYDKLCKLSIFGMSQGLPMVQVAQTRMPNEESLRVWEGKYLEAGYEGVMLRSYEGRYKYGRSTLNEGWLLKFKRTTDSEAVVIGFEELMHNANEAKTNALGHAERSSHKANKVGLGALGALVVRDVTSGVEFNIGTGFDAATRQDLWTRRNLPGGQGLFGRLVKYRYQPVGVKEKPRFPVFLGFRDARDM